MGVKVTLFAFPVVVRRVSGAVHAKSPSTVVLPTVATPPLKLLAERASPTRILVTVGAVVILGVLFVMFTAILFMVTCYLRGGFLHLLHLDRCS